MREKLIINNISDASLAIDGVRSIDSGDSLTIQTPLAILKYTQSDSLKNYLDDGKITVLRYLDDELINTYDTSNSADLLYARKSDATGGGGGSATVSGTIGNLVKIGTSHIPSDSGVSYTLLSNATSSNTPSTLVKRDVTGKSSFGSLRIGSADVDYDGGKLKFSASGFGMYSNSYFDPDAIEASAINQGFEFISSTNSLLVTSATPGNYSRVKIKSTGITLNSMHYSGSVTETPVLQLTFDAPSARLLILDDGGIVSAGFNGVLVGDYLKSFSEWDSDTNGTISVGTKTSILQTNWSIGRDGTIQTNSDISATVTYVQDPDNWPGVTIDKGFIVDRSASKIKLRDTSYEMEISPTSVAIRDYFINPDGNFDTDGNSFLIDVNTQFAGFPDAWSGTLSAGNTGTLSGYYIAGDIIMSKNDLLSTTDGTVSVGDYTSLTQMYWTINSLGTAVFQQVTLPVDGSGLLLENDIPITWNGGAGNTQMTENNGVFTLDWQTSNSYLQHGYGIVSIFGMNGITLQVGSGYIDFVNSNVEQCGRINFDTGLTNAGTTGNQTINKPTGTVNIAAGQLSIVVTNSLCTQTSIVYAVVRTNDSTAVIKNVVPDVGSFTIRLTATATAETSIGFIVFNH